MPIFQAFQGCFGLLLTMLVLTQSDFKALIKLGYITGT